MSGGKVSFPKSSSGLVVARQLVWDRGLVAASGLG